MAKPYAPMPAPAAAGESISPSPDRKVVGVSLVVLLAGALLTGVAVSGRQATLYLVGAALGLILYHSAFGFAGAWRAFVVDRRGAGLRAHLLLLALTSILFLPALAGGSLFGRAVSGNVAPVGLLVVIGAFMFGLGMQLGGG
jgi:uncharacterized membrane protein YedE/YeeE